MMTVHVLYTELTYSQLPNTIYYLYLEKEIFEVYRIYVQRTWFTID